MKATMQMFKACYFVPLFLCILSGCSSEPRSNYAAVGLIGASGKITQDGEAVPNAVVVFEHVEDGTMSYAMTSSSGDFVLQFDSEMAGVKPGKKRVEISTTRRILGLNTSEGSSESESDPDDVVQSQEKIPACYNKETKLAVEVTSSTTTFNFDLKSDCSTTGALN